MPIKVIYTYTRSHPSIEWKNPDKAVEWQKCHDNASPLVGLIEFGEQKYSDDGLWMQGYQIYEDMESLIRSEAYHPDLYQLRQDQRVYRDKVGIKMTTTFLDLQTGIEIPFAEYLSKIQQLELQGVSAQVYIK